MCITFTAADLSGTGCVQLITPETSEVCQLKAFSAHLLSMHPCPGSCVCVYEDIAEG